MSTDTRLAADGAVKFSKEQLAEIAKRAIDESIAAREEADCAHRKVVEARDAAIAAGARAAALSEIAMKAKAECDAAQHTLQ